MKRRKAGTSKTAVEDRRARFVEAYIRLNGNATQAAIEAGFPKRSARSRGHELVKDRDIFAAITERRAQVLAGQREETRITVERMQESMARDVFFDPAKLYNEDGSLKHILDLDENTRLALRSVEVEEIFAGGGKNRKVIGRTAKIRFPEKTAAREQGFKHLGMYKAHQEQAGRAAGAAAGAAIGRAIAEPLDWDSIEARIKARMEVKRRANAGRPARPAVQSSTKRN